MSNNLLCTVQVRINNNPITTYEHKGDTYIEGRPGSAYEILVTNRSYKRVKVVVSVDGLSVMDGQPAAHDSKGYIIGGLSSTTIKGWRVSDDAVNQFVFGSKKNSYSAKLGEGTQNVGVIGVAVFTEIDTYRSTPCPDIWSSGYGPMYWISENTGMGAPLRGYGYSTSTPPVNSLAAVQCSASNAQVSASVGNSEPISNLGTEFGKQVKSAVTSVVFNCSDTPSQLITIYYDDRRGLEARGIVVDKRYEKPDPFPMSNTYCRPV